MYWHNTFFFNYTMSIKEFSHSIPLPPIKMSSWVQCVCDSNFQATSQNISRLSPKLCQSDPFFQINRKMSLKWKWQIWTSILYYDNTRFLGPGAHSNFKNSHTVIWRTLKQPHQKHYCPLSLTTKRHPKVAKIHWELLFSYFWTSIQEMHCMHYRSTPVRTVFLCLLRSLNDKGQRSKKSQYFSSNR